MAIGDLAVARGWRLCPGTANARDIDDEINRVLDILAAVTAEVLSIAKGGTGSTSAAGAREALGITSANIPDSGGTSIRTNIQFIADQVSNLGSDVFRKGETYSRGQIDTAFGSRDTNINYIDGRASAALDGNLTSAVYNRSITGTRRAAWIQDNGQLGFAASSERYKKFIRPEDVTDEQILMLSLVSFQWKAAVAVDDRREMGLIAERLVDAGLGWACYFDGDGQVEGINYEQIGVATLPAVQRLISRTHRLDDDLDTAADRITALEARLDALEATK